MASSALLDVANCQDGPREPVVGEIQALLTERYIGAISPALQEAIMAYILFGSRRSSPEDTPRFDPGARLFCGVLLLEHTVVDPDSPSRMHVGTSLPALLTAAFQLGGVTVSHVSVWLRTIIDRIPQCDHPTASEGRQSLICLAALACQAWLLEQDADRFESIHSEERSAMSKWETEIQADPRDLIASVLELDPYMSMRDDWVQLLAKTISRIGRAQQITNATKAEIG